MSIDTVNGETKANTDTKDKITWKVLIRDAELQISEAKTRIKRLQEAVCYFKEQDSCGKVFPNV